MSDDEAEVEVFKENLRGKDREMWAHFLRERNGKSAKCKICSSVIKTGGGSTSGLRRHLRLVHNINGSAKPDECATASKKLCTPSVGTFFPVVVRDDRDDNTLPHIVARMTALDGLPFRVFATSTDIRAGLIARGFPDLPASPNRFREMVMAVHNKLKMTVVAEFQKLKVSVELPFSYLRSNTILNSVYKCVFYSCKAIGLH